MNITVKEIDPFSDTVYNFRKEIITVDEKYSDTACLEKDIDRIENMPEEVWKFSTRKWNKIGLTQLHGVFVGNELACISGSRLYGENNLLRLGMHYYVLKRFRKVCRSWLWKPQGLIEHALKNYDNLDYSFVTIYPHNSRLESWCKALIRGKRYGQIGNGTEHLELLNSFKMQNGYISFNGVPQYVLYRQEKNKAMSYEDMISKIADLHKQPNK